MAQLTKPGALCHWLLGALGDASAVAVFPRSAQLTGGMALLFHSEFLPGLLANWASSQHREGQACSEAERENVWLEEGTRQVRNTDTNKGVSGKEGML